jgi:hypothetical protein
MATERAGLLRPGSQSSANSSFSNFEDSGELHRCEWLLEIGLRPFMQKTDLMRSEGY